MGHQCIGIYYQCSMVHNSTGPGYVVSYKIVDDFSYLSALDMTYLGVQCEQCEQCVTIANVGTVNSAQSIVYSVHLPW